MIKKIMKKYDKCYLSENYCDVEGTFSWELWYLRWRAVASQSIAMYMGLLLLLFVNMTLLLEFRSSLLFLLAKFSIGQPLQNLT